MEDAEVIRVAREMSALYSDDAVRQALARADKLLGLGDIAGCEDWRHVAATITELNKRRPSDAVEESLPGRVRI